MPNDASGRVVVNTLNDVKSIIKDFMPGTESKKNTITTELRVGNTVKKINAVVDGSNNRDLLLEGFTILKHRMEANNSIPEDAVSPVNLEGRMWLDDLIEHRMGGVRDGLKVKWDLTEGTYKFDPFSGKLTCLQ